MQPMNVSVRHLVMVGVGGNARGHDRLEERSRGSQVNRA